MQGVMVSAEVIERLMGCLGVSGTFMLAVAELDENDVDHKKLAQHLVEYAESMTEIYPGPDAIAHDILILTRLLMTAEKNREVPPDAN